MFSIQGQILDFCVLAIVNRRDTYGYEITQKLMATIEISESTLYPVLRRLLKGGLLESYDIAFEGRNRRYYRITRAGRDVLIFNKEKWDLYVEQVNQIIGGSDE